MPSVTHGDEIDALDLLADDEGRRLVVGIGGAGADGRDEAAAGVDELAVPRAGGRRTAPTAPPVSARCSRMVSGSQPHDAPPLLP